MSRRVVVQQEKIFDNQSFWSNSLNSVTEAFHNIYVEVRSHSDVQRNEFFALKNAMNMTFVFDFVSRTFFAHGDSWLAHLAFCLLVLKGPSFASMRRSFCLGIKLCARIRTEFAFFQNVAKNLVYYGFNEFQLQLFCTRYDG